MDYLIEAKKYYKNGNYSEAKKHFDLEYRQNNSTDALFGSALCDYELKDYKASLLKLNHLIDKDPANPLIYNQIGIIAFESGDTSTAHVMFRKSLEQDSKFKAGYQNLFDTIDKSDNEQRIEILKQTALEFPTDIDAIIDAIKQIDVTGIHTDYLAELVELLNTNSPNHKYSKKYKHLIVKQKQVDVIKTNNPLKILFLQNSPCIRNYKYAQALKARGHSVTLGYTDKKLSEVYTGLNDDVYAGLIKIQNYKDLWDISKNYDLIHSHNEPDTLTVAALAGECPVIHDTHDLISLRDIENESTKYFEGIANRGGQGRIYSTPYQQAEANLYYGSEQPSLVYYNYASASDIPETHKPKLSAQDGNIHIVYEGGISTSKHRNFIDIFTDIAQKNIHIHIYPTKFDAQLDEFFKKFPTIHYYQPISPKRIIYEMSQYDFGIIPWNLKIGQKKFLDSTIANKLFEYLAAGLPVFTSNVQSYVDFFSENPVGTVFYDADDLIEKLPGMRDIAKNVDLSKYVCTYESEVERLENYYHEIIFDYRNSEKNRVQSDSIDREELQNLAVQAVKKQVKQEYETQTFSMFNERPVEFGFVFKKIGEIYPLKVLDVGTGTTALPHLMRNCGCLVTAIDNVHDYWTSGMFNRHYHVIDDDITKTSLNDKFDLITCISVLEHVQKSDEAIRNIFSLIKSGGHLILSFPYNEKKYVKNVYNLPGSTYGQNVSYITQAYSRKELNRWIEDNKGTIIDQEYWQFWDHDYWTVGKQIIPPKRVTQKEKHQITCILIRKS